MKVGLKIWFDAGDKVYRGQVTEVYNGSYSIQCAIRWEHGDHHRGYTESEFWNRFKVDETQMAEDLLRKYENAEGA